MTGWVIVAIVAIVMSGLVSIFTDRKQKGLTAGDDRDRASAALALAEAREEIGALRDRIAVLERIATDRHAPSALDTRRIAEEIEALRDRQPPGP